MIFDVRFSLGVYILKNLKFPLIYILEFLLYIPLLVGGYFTSTFVASEPIAKLNLNGKSLPDSWEAAVFNHGMYLEGYIIQNHLFNFFCSVLLLVVTATAIYHVHKAQQLQVKAAAENYLVAHKIANVLTFIAVGGLFYLALI